MGRNVCGLIAIRAFFSIQLATTRFDTPFVMLSPGPKGRFQAAGSHEAANIAMHSKPDKNIL